MDIRGISEVGRRQDFCSRLFRERERESEGEKQRIRTASYWIVIIPNYHRNIPKQPASEVWVEHTQIFPCGCHGNGQYLRFFSVVYDALKE